MRSPRPARTLRITTITLWLIITADLAAQARRAEIPIRTSVSELAARPRTFSGRRVLVASEVILGRGPLILSQANHRILVSEPAEANVKPKANFVLIKDSNWQRLNQAVRPKPPGTQQQQAVAVVEGRFDSTLASWRYRLLRLNLGYGHMGLYHHRLVVHRVHSVELTPAAH